MGGVLPCSCRSHLLRCRRHATQPASEIALLRRFIRGYFFGLSDTFGNRLCNHVPNKWIGCSGREPTRRRTVTQGIINISHFHGVDTRISDNALRDYTKWRLTHLQALAALLSAQDPSCNAVNADILELNRALVDEICDLVPLVVDRK